MSLYTQPNLTGGLDSTLIEVTTAVPSFMIGFLVFVFGIVFLGGVTAQKRRTGFADFPLWATMASLSTFMISLILTLKEGLISLEVLSVVIAITVFSGLWLFLSKGRGEV